MVQMQWQQHRRLCERLRQRYMERCAKAKDEMVSLCHLAKHFVHVDCQRYTCELRSTHVPEINRCRVHHHLCTPPDLSSITQQAIHNSQQHQPSELPSQEQEAAPAG